MPKSTENVSRELVKLKWHIEDIEVFTGFGPWTKPTGFEPPNVHEKQKQNKKKKKKEITSKINTGDIPKSKNESDEIGNGFIASGSIFIINFGIILIEY